MTIGAALLLVLLLGAVVAFKFVQIMMSSGNVDGNIVQWAGQPGYSLKEIIGHPGNTISMLVNTVWVKFSFYAIEILGAELAWLDLEIPVGFVLPFLVLLVLACFRREDEKIKINMPERIWMWLMGAGVIALTMLAMLLNWTPRYLKFIEGVQGRYFLPVLPLILLACRTKKACIGKDTEKVIIFLAVFWQVIIEVCVLKTMILY